MRILLVAGHGQGDPGAVGCGYKEADLTRKVVAGMEPILSRYAEVVVFDPAVKMSNFLARGGKYNFSSFDYVMEIHFNAIAKSEADKKIKGSEALVHPTEKFTTVEKAVLKNLNAIGFTNRGIKKRTDLIVMNTCASQGVSYALVEVCFIDDPDDMKLYINNSSLVNEAIAEGIIEGFELKPLKPLLTKADEIAWELNHTYFPITDLKGFIEVLDEAKKKNSPLYWGFYKLTNKIRSQ